MQSEQITSKAAGLYTLTVGVGELLGPLIGRILYGLIGYEWTITAMSGVIVVCGVLFVIWGGVCERKRGRKRPLKFD